LHCAGRTHVVEYPACTAGAIEAGECEYLAGYKLAGLIGVHHSGHRRRDYRTGRDRPYHKTRKHPGTPTLLKAGNAWSLYPLLTIRTVATLEQLGW
jgi:hypothetical protein